MLEYDDQEEEVSYTPEDNLVLVKYEGNWADEMDISGHYVTTQEGYNDEVEVFKAMLEHDSITYCVGTNEEIEYETIDELLECFTATPITFEEYTVLTKLELDATGFVGPEAYIDSDDDDCVVEL